MILDPKRLKAVHNYDQLILCGGMYITCVCVCVGGGGSVVMGVGGWVASVCA